MKRKLFSAILFGALLTASTSGLTSCKDYDDDISNLQSQIDKLATADQLSAKVSEMQAAIAAAQSAAESKAAAAQTVADAAKAAAADAAAAASKAQGTADAAAAAAAEVQKAADKAIADLEAKAATKADLEAAAQAAQAAVEAIKAEHATDKAKIEAAIETGLAEVKAEIAATNDKLAGLATRLDAVEEKLAAIEAGEGQEEKLEAIQAEVESISDELEALGIVVSEMITDISLYTSGIADLTGFNTSLDFWQVKEAVDRKFPFGDDVKDITDGTIEFKKDAVKMYDDSVLVRVNPVNAVLNAEDISLVNSQGVALGKDIIEEISVKPYQKDVPMVKSAGGETGLWVVKFKANDNYDKDAFDAATKYNKKNICFAVAVKSNILEEADRNLVTAYDLVVNNNVAKHATTFKVNNTPVANIHNRFNAFTNPLAGTFPADVKGKDYTWVDATEDITSFVTPDDDKDNFNALSNDNRQARPTLTVEEGDRISIDFDDAIAIRGFYVALDWKRSGESGNSEINAWNKYDYTNVGKISYEGKVLEAAPIQYGNHGFISVNELKDYATEGDVIGFRVWAINLDGTMVDPDGQAFYVGVGASSEVETKTVPAAKILVTAKEGDIPADSNKVVINLTDYLKDIDYTTVVFAGTTTEANDDKWDSEAETWRGGHKPTLYTGTRSAGADAEDVKYTWNATTKKLTLQIVAPKKLVDEKTYTIAAEVKAVVGSASKVVRKLNIKFTKVMPKATDPLYAIDLRMYQTAEQVPNLAEADFTFADPTTTAYKWTKSVYKSWGDVVASNSGSIIPAGIAKAGDKATLDLNQVYYFKNLNKKLNEAQTYLQNTSIKYAIEKADYKSDGNDEHPNAKDLAVTGTRADILAQFVNGKAYPVYAEIQYSDISHKLIKQNNNTYEWDKKDGATYNNLDLKVYAGTNVVLKPWSTVADGYVSYGWIKKIKNVVYNSSNQIVRRDYMDNNEVKWVNGAITTPKMAAKIDLRNIQMFYGKQLINLTTPGATYTNYQKENLGGITAANGCGVTFRPTALNANGNPDAWSDLNVWVEAADGQISDYFSAEAIANAGTTSQIVVKQLSDRLAGNITVYLCMELIDRLGHSEVVKLPLSIVDQYTTTYDYDQTYGTPGSNSTDLLESSSNWATWYDKKLIRVAE